MIRLLPTLLLCIAAGLTSLYLGQDGGYDLRNYHIYNAWAVLTNRWSYDVFAAGTSTFFSPFLDIPYYLVATKLFPSHGKWMVALGGIPYGALLYLVYLVSKRIAVVLQFDTEFSKSVFVVLSVLLAGTSAATWSVVGMTSNDITVAAIDLAGFYQALLGLTDSGEERYWFRRVAVAGLLLGLAMGLKLTAAIYVPSMALVVLFAARSWRTGIRGLIVYGCLAFAGFVVAYGPWGWTLYQLTGNPFFPMFNGVFHSDWIAHIDLRDTRFLPRSPLQWLFYPFYWTTLQSGLVTEVPFRDARLALAYASGVGCAIGLLVSKDTRVKVLSDRYKAIRALVLFIVASYILWMYEFSILRYLVALECLASIFIVICLMALAQKLRHLHRWFPAIGASLTVCLIVAYTVSPPWGRMPAGTDILAVQAPTFEPGALIVFADVPMSFLAPGLEATSQNLRFMTIPRAFPSRKLGDDTFKHELGRRMRRQIQENQRAIYVLFQKPDGPPQSSLAEFNIKIDLSSCQTGHSALEPEFLACRGIYQDARQPAG